MYTECNMMLIERLKLLRISWQTSNESPNLFYAVVDGLKVELRVVPRAQVETASVHKTVCTLIYGLSEIDLDEMPARWSLPIGFDAKIKSKPAAALQKKIS